MTSRLCHLDINQSNNSFQVLHTFLAFLATSALKPAAACVSFSIVTLKAEDLNSVSIVKVEKRRFFIVRLPVKTIERNRENGDFDYISIIYHYFFPILIFFINYRCANFTKIQRSKILQILP